MQLYASKHSQLHLAQHTALTIIIHGVWFPIISSIIHKMNCPLGLTPAHLVGDDYTLGKIGKILHEVSPDDFAAQSVYVFGWQGALGFAIREQAARQLYQSIKEYRGPITIIAHSHGCNVALNLAKIAHEDTNTHLCINKLILLAGPVQHVTEQYVDSPLFKRIYSFYSKIDIAQVIDPQGLYYHTHKKARTKNVSFFSRRTFSSPKVLQAQIVLDHKHPHHNDFLYEPFLRKLPLLIQFMEHAVTTVCAHTKSAHVLINIPREDMPHVLKIYS
jgi:hypothetical protein